IAVCHVMLGSGLLEIPDSGLLEIRVCQTLHSGLANWLRGDLLKPLHSSLANLPRGGLAKPLRSSLTASPYGGMLKPLRDSLTVLPQGLIQRPNYLVNSHPGSVNLQLSLSDNY
ncbi:hypothetical protein Tco_0094276, partial [Tanacetum coccineum]